MVDSIQCFQRLRTSESVEHRTRHHRLPLGLLATRPRREILFRRDCCRGGIQPRRLAHPNPHRLSTNREHRVKENWHILSQTLLLNLQREMPGRTQAINLATYAPMNQPTYSFQSLRIVD